MPKHPVYDYESKPGRASGRGGGHNREVLGHQHDEYSMRLKKKLEDAKASGDKAKTKEAFKQWQTSNERWGKLEEDEIDSSIAATKAGKLSEGRSGGWVREDDPMADQPKKKKKAGMSSMLLNSFRR